MYNLCARPKKYDSRDSVEKYTNFYDTFFTNERISCSNNDKISLLSPLFSFSFLT